MTASTSGPIEGADGEPYEHGDFSDDTPQVAGPVVDDPEPDAQPESSADGAESTANASTSKAHDDDNAKRAQAAAIQDREQA